MTTAPRLRANSTSALRRRIDMVTPRGNGWDRQTQTTRPATDTVRDANRKPPETLAFAGVKPNPADPHTAGVFDPSIRGRTDQFILEFQRPPSS
jgi:hypothetical protein